MGEVARAIDADIRGATVWLRVVVRREIPAVNLRAEKS